MIQKGKSRNQSYLKPPCLSVCPYKGGGLPVIRRYTSGQPDLRPDRSRVKPAFSQLQVSAYLQVSFQYVIFYLTS